MTTDHFADERRSLNIARDSLHDSEIMVILGELVADNLLGDPTLRPTLRYADHARSLIDAAYEMLNLAVTALPEPTEETITP